jgi:hypothetical protein
LLFGTNIYLFSRAKLLMSEQIIQQNKCGMAYSNGVNIFIECVAAVAYRTLVLMFHFVQHELIVIAGEVTSFLAFCETFMSSSEKIKIKITFINNFYILCSTKFILLRRGIFD